MERSRIVTGLVTSVCLFVAAVQAADLPSAGSKAPEFSLSSQEGTPVSLKEFRGKWVVLYFYPKDMTKGCTIEAHNFQRDLAQVPAEERRGAGRERGYRRFAPTVLH